MVEDSERRRQEPPEWARRDWVRPSGWRAGEGQETARPRIVIVGPCAAGKTTLVARLQELGFDAHACAQEHSGVPYLWQLSAPDLLIFLDVNLATTSARRGCDWPANLHAAQQQRLAHARAHADLYLDSSSLTPDEVARLVDEFVNARGEAQRSQV